METLAIKSIPDLMNSFDLIATSATKQLDRKTDDQLKQMIAEYHQKENSFWSMISAESSRYTKNEIKKMRKTWMSNLSYPPSLKIVLDSLYNLHLDSYFDQFKNQIQVIDNNDLRDDPYNTLQSLTRFLELRAFFWNYGF